MMGKIVVTGGAGMIGSSLVLRLLQKGNKVLVLDNLSSGKKENLQTLAKKFKGYEFVEGDIKDLALLKKQFEKASCVFHLAANPDIKFRESDQTDTDLKENTIGTYNVLEAMRACRVEKIVFASSSAIYGEPTIFPTPESYGPLKPISLYGASKLADEALITAFSHLFNMQAWIFRLANIVGEKSRKKGTTVLTDFIDKLKKDNKNLEILGDGKQKKSFLWLEDCVDGILKLFSKANNKVNIINVGNTDYISIDELAEIVIREMELTNVKITHTGGVRGWKGDSPVMLMDVSFAKRLGWSPKHLSKEAITLSVKALLSLR